MFFSSDFISGVKPLASKGVAASPVAGAAVSDLPDKLGTSGGAPEGIPAVATEMSTALAIGPLR